MIIRNRGLFQTQDLNERFWTKVKTPSGIGECWLWQASKRSGYGVFSIGHKTVSAHRFTYQRIIGPIPVGYSIDHLCRNPACVNPYHLEPVTQRVNILRGIGPSAKNAVKTYCSRGHLLEGNNIEPGSWRKRGFRNCKPCANLRRRKEFRQSRLLNKKSVNQNEPRI